MTKNSPLTRLSKGLPGVFFLVMLCLLAIWPSPTQAATLEATQKRAVTQFGTLRPHAWGEKLPGVQCSFTPQGNDGFIVALTLDACGGKAKSYDADLIAFLRKHSIPATLFLSNTWIQRHQDTFRALAADPLFEIAAHGARHKPASVSGKSAYGIRGTLSVADLVQEVESNAEMIHKLSGSRPAWFRSGTAFYDDVAVKVIHSLDLRIAGYSIAADEGATLPAAEVAKHVLAAKPGDIILCHMNHPESGTREGLKTALPQLLEQGARFVRLSETSLPATK